MEISKETVLKYSFERKREAGNDIFPHTHDGWELIYYISGSGKYIIGDNVYGYSDGNFVFVPPETVHSEHADSDTLLLCAVFDTDFSCGITATDDRKEYGLYSDTGGDILTVMRRIMSETRGRLSGYEQIVSRLIEVIMLYTERKTSEKTAMKYIPDPIFETAVSYIRDYYTTDIDLSALASMAGYSYDRFRHLFKERYGMPPGRYLLEIRLDAAKRMLRDEKHRGTGIKAIALSSGFPSYAGFASVFTREVGITPRDYRRKSTGV